MKTDASLSLTIQTLRRKWEENPTHPLVFQLADEYRRIERFDLAAEVLQKQVESYPQHFSARVALGRCRLELGEPRLAADVIEPVVAVDPTHLIANKLLAKAYLQLGEATKARDRLDLYVLLNDDDWEIDELERQLRELDDGQASVLPEAQPDASAGVNASIEKIEQELLNPSTPESLAAGGGGAQLNEPPELEENDRDSDPSEAGKEEPSSDQMQGAVGSDEVELSQEQEHPEISHPSEASDSSEAVGSSSQLVVEKPREPPSDTTSHPIEESSRDTSSQSSAQVEPEAPGAPREEQPETAPDATPKVTPAELQEESTVSISKAGFIEASTSTSGGLDPKSSVPAPPPVLREGIKTPFQVDSRRLKSASLKRLLAAGGIFSFESPGRVFITGKSGDSGNRTVSPRNRIQGLTSQQAWSQAEPTVTLGSLYMQQGHHAEARRIFSQVLRREPANQRASGALAQLDRLREKRLTAKDLLKAGRRGATTLNSDSLHSDSREESAQRSKPLEQKIMVLNQYLGYFKRAEGEPKV